MKEIIDKTTILMQKSFNTFLSNLDKIRAGRANPSILFSIKIFIDNNEILLGHISTMSVANINVVIITPFDKNLLSEIDRAIKKKNLNLSSIILQNTIKVIFPLLSLEERQKLIKYLSGEVEINKVSIRNIRREAKNNLMLQVKNKVISSDEEKTAMKSIQKITDKYIIDIDSFFKNKEKELLNN